ncbi:hypothetical protein PHAVU_008G111600 [Phaseolus vulgaris]|uniref:Uncharacterized protein n=1 Tax=Phaseolus vulgaris TaxID=3885 RepID=V7B6F2_PHAVU|nr:hypothetical protein PHAVU_008G111600g [Phaseolus vulgaris]ESW12428.1 hypothetical protein PHAVU_008G111600g [Phaseolus vulgaris]
MITLSDTSTARKKTHQTVIYSDRNIVERRIVLIQPTNEGKLDLSNNNFTGNIGSSLASLTSLEYLAFDGNQFEVPISFTPFFNHSNLKFIYGNGNKVILDSHSSMKKWVPKFQLQVLSLSSTTESHSLPIPSFLHYQYNLTYLDITGCKLEGEFPKWLLENNTKMTYLVLKNCSFTQFQLPSYPHLHLAEMNVSDNAISESLDLSFNKLSGEIPTQLSELTFLSSFNVSYNNLSGAIERKEQFLTFEESCFIGNPLLCGPPLARSCNPAPDVLPNDSDIGSWVDMLVFCVTFAVSYTSFLLVTAAALYINPYWRQLSFYYAELVSLNCFYFIKDSLCKLCKIGNA